jgi:hypothetical protein
MARLRDLLLARGRGVFDLSKDCGNAALPVVGPNGQVLRRGHELGAVLRVLERKLIRAVDI